MAYRVDNLEIKIKSQAQAAITQLDKLTGRLNTVANASQRAFSTVGAAGASTTQVASAAATTAKATSGLFNISKIMIAAHYIKQIGEGLAYCVTQSNSFVENSNLLQVAMGEMTNEAMRFQFALNEAFGSNISEMMRFQGLFMSMAKSMNGMADTSYMMSENLTKMGYDIASLFNIQIEAAMQKLRAGLAGQTKPLRDVGLDITQQTLQPVLESIGIYDRTVKQLSQGEKQILRVISIGRQLGQSWVDANGDVQQLTNTVGDFARTIEQPANQLKILKDQLAELANYFGQLFYGLMRNMLPRLNAFVMVVKELVQWVGTLMGVQIESTAQSLADTGVDDLTEDLEGAAAAANDLKNAMLGIDELNVISPTTAAGVGGSSTAIDDRLLAALQEYDNLMEGVRMKATAIRDAWMEALGFIKDVNEVTGEVNFEWQGVKEMSGLALAGIELMGGPIGHIALQTADMAKNSEDFRSGVETLHGAFKAFWEWFTNTKLVKGIEELAEKIKGLIPQSVIDAFDDLDLTIMDFIALFNPLTEFFEFVTLGIRALGDSVNDAGLKFMDAGEKWEGFLVKLMDKDGWIGKAIQWILDLVWAVEKLFAAIRNQPEPPRTVWTPDYETWLADKKQEKLDEAYAQRDKLFPKTTTESGMPIAKIGPSSTTRSDLYADEFGRPFATGGHPSYGEIFTARENGMVEMLGRIGSTPTVATNADIVASVSKGVYDAVSSALGSGESRPINVYLGGEQIDKQVYKMWQSGKAMSGTPSISGAFLNHG